MYFCLFCDIYPIFLVFNKNNNRNELFVVVVVVLFYITSFLLLLFYFCIFNKCVQVCHQFFIYRFLLLNTERLYLSSKVQVIKIQKKEGNFFFIYRSIKNTRQVASQPVACVTLFGVFCFRFLIQISFDVFFFCSYFWLKY